MRKKPIFPYEPTWRIRIGSSIFLAYVFLSIPPFGLAILFSLPLPFAFRYAISRAWAATLMVMIKYCCGLTYRIDGLENIPKDQPFIVLAKHQSAWETLTTRLFLPKQTAVLKRSLTWIPISGWALATLKPIAINRDKKQAAMRTIVRQGTARLKEGFIVIVFPEGTRAAPGEDLPFSTGGALLAQMSGYPVVPMAHNAGTYWPRYSFFKYPGIIHAKLGKPISSKGKKAAQINQEAQDWIAQTMREL